MDHLLNLKVFIRLVELGSFSRAAEQLRMAPASVTTHLAQLESHLGAKLVNRNTRKLSITEEGNVLYEAAAFLLQEFQQIEQRFANTATAPHGKLRVSAPPLAAVHILVPALPKFLERYPEVQIELGISTRFVDLVQEGLDCAVRVGTLPDSSLISRPLGFLRMVTVASSDYLAEHREPTLPRELDKHICIGFLSPATGRVAEWVFEKDQSRVTHHVSGPLTLGCMQACVQAATMGLGITQVVSLAARNALGAGKVKEVLTDWSAIGPPVQLVYEKSRMPSARLRAFIDFAMEIFPQQLLPDDMEREIGHEAEVTRHHSTVRPAKKGRQSETARRS